VLEAIEKELAFLAEKTSGRKSKKEARTSSTANYVEEIAGLQRRLDMYEEFIRVWELKLKKWDSFIEELHKAKFASDDEGKGGEAQKVDIRNEAPKTSVPIETRGDDESDHMTSESSSGESNSNSRSESEGDKDKVTVEPAKSTKLVQPMQEVRPSNTTGSTEEIVKKDKEKSCNNVADKNAGIEEQGRASEPHPKTVGKGASRVAQTEDSLNNTANVTEKVTPTEGFFFFVLFLELHAFNFAVQ
jgi:hypothetical protein